MLSFLDDYQRRHALVSPCERRKLRKKKKKKTHKNKKRKKRHVLMTKKRRVLMAKKRRGEGVDTAEHDGHDDEPDVAEATFMLPSNTVKEEVYEEYVKTLMATAPDGYERPCCVRGHRRKKHGPYDPCSFSHFTMLWKRLKPDLVISAKGCDFCSTCTQFETKRA